MNKIDMYQKVPEQFHNKIYNTLEQLEEKKVVRFSVRKFAIACAVTMLAASTITVGAMELFQWHQTARESLGTSQELENKLTNQGVAVSAEDTDKQQDITITALQSVKTGEDFYLLAVMEWPKNLEWNDDILFEKSKVNSVQELQECTAHFVDAPDENGTVFVEIQVRDKSNYLQYASEAKIILTNLIQTSKTAYVDTLVEAEWELTFKLPKDADVKSFMVTQSLPVNGHNIILDKVEIGPFGVKLYTGEEQGRHAAYYSNMELAAVLYEDGSKVENYGAFLQKSAAIDETGNFYYHLSLQNAVDIDKVSGLLFKEDGEEYIYQLDENILVQLAGNGNLITEKEDDLGKEVEKVSLLDLVPQDSQVTDFHILYARYDYSIITDNKFIYQWDAACNHAEVIVNLADCGFDAEKGGNIAMMPGGVVLTVHPTADSGKVYMIEMDTFNMYESDTDGIWSVPRYEEYKNSFFQVAEKANLEEGYYAPEGYEWQGNAYALYSADGSVEKMELVDLNNK